MAKKNYNPGTSTNICFKCKWANTRYNYNKDTKRHKCEWIGYGHPMPDEWTDAKPTQINYGYKENGYIDTYCIKACKMFEPDPPRAKPEYQLAQEQTKKHERLASIERAREIQRVKRLDRIMQTLSKAELLEMLAKKQAKAN